MLDLKLFAENRPLLEESYRRRNKTELIAGFERVDSLDRKRKEGIQAVEGLKARRNAASIEIARLKKEKKDDTAILAEMKAVAAEIKALDEKQAVVEAELQACLMEFPNVVDASVPAGKGTEENVEVRRWGNPRQFSFAVKSHDEIGEKLGLLDFKKAGEVTGARFVFLRGLAARLELALINFMMDRHLKAGYEPIIPPFLVNRDALTGTGQLPKFEEDVFRIEKFDFFLTPTAEVPVTNYHRNEIADEKDLPRRYVAYSPCFRSEAGSYGKDTKGLKRQHQFNKVELVKFSPPGQSMEELESMVKDAEGVLQALNLPYRVMLLCGGDMGFSSTKTYDIEVWSPFLKSYMEISSCSNCADFQARRAQIRYRDSKSKQVQYVHTLNGSGLAVGRTLLAIVENYQREDGTIEIPEALQKFMLG